MRELDSETPGVETDVARVRALQAEERRLEAGLAAAEDH
jgi:hypothetical protein